MEERHTPERPARYLAVLAILMAALGTAAPQNASAGSALGSAVAADRALDRALKELVTLPGGPPGAMALVQRGRSLAVHAFGVREIGGPQRPGQNDIMRVASIAKAFSGAAVLSLVHHGVLALDDTIGRWLPELPAAWHAVTLRQLLNHTSGLPDYTQSAAFRDAVTASPTVALPPSSLLAFVAAEPLNFASGTRYLYSNSDNIAVGLMIESATGQAYEAALKARVTGPLHLGQTTLPGDTALPAPFIHGYDFTEDGAPEDVSEVLAAGWAWASGGVISTPADLNRFMRGYVRGRLVSGRVLKQQRRWIPGGGSEPPGPGRNSAGLGLFRYQTRCGTVFGHTGNTFGFTQFAAASPNGARSVTVTMSLQRTSNSPGWQRAVFEALRVAEEQAVWAALAR